MLNQTETTRVWSGDLDELKAMAGRGFITPDLVARPRAIITRGIARIVLSGIVTEPSWHELAAEIGAASSRRKVKAIALQIDSIAQECEGFQLALKAVIRCHKPIHAHIYNAVGMVAALAANCDKKFAESTEAKIGPGEIDSFFIQIEKEN